MNTPSFALNTVVAAVLLSGISTSAFAASYKVEILPQAPFYQGGTLATSATDINNNGEVAGSTSVGESGTGSVYWNSAGQITNLTPEDSPTVTTAGLSDTGTVVYSDTNFGGPFFAWNAGILTQLGTGYATAVNGKGQIAGTFDGVFGIWTEGTVTPLPLPALGSAVWANDINNNGDVVGAVYFSDTRTSHAVVWRNGTVHVIGTLAGDFRSEANAINDAGQVVGYSSSSTNKWRAFMWDNGVLSDLSLATDAQSFALGINNMGQVVGGSADLGSYYNKPFVWQAGVRTDLSSVVGDGANCTASDINNSGALVTSCAANVIYGNRVFRLTPVASAADLSVNLSATPVPATAGLPLVYTTAVTNIGSVTSANAMLTQTLPASGFTLGSITSTKGSCSGTSVVTCAFGDLEPGADAVVKITATPLPVSYSAYFQSSAVVATSTPEVNTLNNAETIKFTVFENESALSVYSKNSQTTARKGANITYTWEVSHGGPQAAANVVLTDTLPSSLAFVSATTTAGTCAGTTTITCNLGDKKYGPITVTIVAKAKVAGTITNSASVTTTTPEKYLGDNKATVVTKVR